MPDVYGGIGQGLESAGASIAQGILARQAAARLEQERKNRLQREKIVAKAKLNARGVSWSPEHDQIIDAGGTADDVVETATAELVQKQTEAKRKADEAAATSAAEDQGRQATVGIERAKNLLKNPQFQAMPRGDPRRQTIADAYLHGTIAQQQDAMKALEPEKPPKPEKATESEFARAARRRFAANNKMPDTPETQLWIDTGGERPGGKQFPTPADRASDREQSFNKLMGERTKKLEEAYTPEDSAKVMTPERIRDSSLAYSQGMATLKQEAAGGEVPAAQEEALRGRLRSLRERLDRLEGRQ